LLDGKDSEEGVFKISALNLKCMEGIELGFGVSYMGLGQELGKNDHRK
jgi:hypothetical protein